MISSVEISNFQSHQHTFIEFDKGLNVLTGTSDHGKSAVIRAINWVLDNKPSGDAFRSWFTKEDTVVTLAFDDGAVIKRVRGQKLNQYEVNGEVFKALKGDVPDAVKNLTQMKEVNFQAQSNPYFLLNETPGNVAKEINAVADLQVMDVALQEVNAGVKKLTGDLKKSEKEVEMVREGLQSIAFLDDMAVDVDGLVAEEVVLIDTSNIIAERDALISSIKYKTALLTDAVPDTAAIELQQLRKICQAIEGEDADIISLEQLVEAADNRAYELEDYNGLDTVHSDLAALVNTERSLVDDEEHIQNVSSLVRNITKLKDEVKGSVDLFEMSSSLNHLVSKHDDIAKLELKLGKADSLVSEIKSCQTVIQHKAVDISELKAELADYKMELGVCPTCDTKFEVTVNGN